MLDHAWLDRLTRMLGPDTLRELFADGVMSLHDRQRVIAECLGAEPSSNTSRDLAGVAHDLVAMAGHLGLGEVAASARALDAAAQAAIVAGGVDDPTRDLAMATVAAIDRGLEALAATGVAATPTPASGSPATKRGEAKR
ncbi:MAG: hypothetical protein AAF577_07335 [Pseudomonadota bacterium]